jgi:hypothetical protein
MNGASFFLNLNKINHGKIGGLPLQRPDFLK